jgi:GH25 family lysozyme M1 (1,4-beta-N-acetylmuramidase)
METIGGKNMNGIDVSLHNENIDWQSVKASGKVDFCIIRAGYGKSISQKDAKFEQNYAGAKAHGIPVGAYWYSYALTPAEAEAEARVFLEAIAGKQFEFPVWFDVEEMSQLHTGKRNVSAIIRAFCGVMEAAGYWVGVYASRSAIQSYFEDDVQKRYSIWAAEWGASLHYEGAAMWQRSDKGRVDGITGNVDLDTSYVDFPTAIKEAGKNGYLKDEPDTEDALPYIPSMTASEVQKYLTWCAAKGAGQYEDTESEFRRFISETYGR